jgi:hypothetical protein
MSQIRTIKVVHGGGATGPTGPTGVTGATGPSGGGGAGGGFLAPVVVATTDNVGLTMGGIPDPSVTDGATVEVGQRILVWQQTDVSEIGVYIVQSGAWTRAPDLPTLFWNPDNGNFDQPSTVDGIMVATGSLGSGFSGAVFQFLAELEGFIPCAGGAVQSLFEYDPVNGPQAMVANGFSSGAVGIRPNGEGPITGTANFVANGSTVDQLRNALIAAGLMKAS